MSIRLLARDLYRSQKIVQQLEDELEVAPLEKRDAIENKLRKARADMQQLKRALDGQIGR